MTWAYQLRRLVIISCCLGLTRKPVQAISPTHQRHGRVTRPGNFDRKRHSVVGLVEPVTVGGALDFSTLHCGSTVSSTLLSTVMYLCSQVASLVLCMCSQVLPRKSQGIFLSGLINLALPLSVDTSRQGHGYDFVRPKSPSPRGLG